MDGMGGGLTFDDVPDPVARPGAVVIRIEATPLLSYLRTFVAGGLTSYSPPGGKFTPGTGGAGVVEAVGDGVYHLAVGQAVLLSPYLTADERVPDPASTLISLHGDPQLNQMWRDGTLADKALMPASVVTPLPPGTGDAVRVTALTRCLVPYGGLVKGLLRPGETVVVHGATGAFGQAGVLVALAMGAAEVVAAGRNRAVLDALAELPRVRTVAMTGDPDIDAAAVGVVDLGLDLVGQASSASGTLAVLKALRRGGRLVLMGSMTVPLPVDYSMLIRGNKDILGAYMYPPQAPTELLRLTAAGLLDLSRIGVETFGLADLVPAMDRAAEPGAPLVVMTPT